MDALFGQKTFRGANVAETMEQVKAEFGNDAIVLDKREIPAKRGLLKSAKPMVEIVAAGAEYQQALKENSAAVAGANSLLTKTYGKQKVNAAAINDVQVELSKYEKTSPLTLTARTGASKTRAAPEIAATPPAHYSALANNGSDLMHAVQEAVRSEMHAEMLRLTSNFACGGVPPVGERFLEVYNHLIENSVDPVLARELVIKLQYELGASPLLSEDVLGMTLQKMIAAEFRIEPVAQLTSAPRPRIVALVGPSGGGKTTTAVKIAFAAAYEQRASVGMITIDNNRPAAEAQLRQLTQVMSLPFAQADTPQRLVEEVRNLTEAKIDLIIIDTGGYSMRDAKGLQELQAYLSALNADEIHLVLSATMAERSALAFAEAYRVCGYNRLLLSKLDEAANFGLALNLARKLPEPFAYLATGQAFRDGLQTATATELARLVCGEVEKEFVMRNYARA